MIVIVLDLQVKTVDVDLRAEALRVQKRAKGAQECLVVLGVRRSRPRRGERGCGHRSDEVREAAIANVVVLPPAKVDPRNLHLQDGRLPSSECATTSLGPKFPITPFGSARPAAVELVPAELLVARPPQTPSRSIYIAPGYREMLPGTLPTGGAGNGCRRTSRTEDRGASGARARVGAGGWRPPGRTDLLTYRLTLKVRRRPTIEPAGLSRQMATHLHASCSRCGPRATLHGRRRDDRPGGRPLFLEPPGDPQVDVPSRVLALDLQERPLVLAIVGFPATTCRLASQHERATAFTRSPATFALPSSFSVTIH